MRTLPTAVCIVLFHAVMAAAQPLPSREELRRIPPGDAIVLDPAGVWEFASQGRDTRQACVAGMDEEAGNPRMIVAEADKWALWHRPLVIPVDPQRYPILIVAYRATGIMPSPTALLQLQCVKARQITPLQNSDVIADGEVHEAVLDLRELEPEGAIRGLSLGVHCRGPEEPAVFTLLGLRFESDGRLPPLEQDEGPEFTLRAVGSDGKAVAGATVTADAERLNSSRSATTDADGRVTIRAMDNPEDKHSLRIAKEGMATIDFVVPQREDLPATVTLPSGNPYGGIVQDEGGKPVPHASVRLNLRAAHPMWLGRQFRSVAVLADARGRWQTPVLPTDGISASVELAHIDYARTRPGRAPLADMQHKRAVLTIVAGALLRGRIIDPGGQPVPGVKLSLAKEVYDPDKELAETDADGRFGFTRRQVGWRELAVIPVGYAPAWPKVRIEAGMADLEIRLEPGRALCGRVVDHKGKPVADARVLADRSHGMSLAAWSGSTDAEGRFVWQHAPEGQDSSLRVWKEGYMGLRDCKASPGDEETTIVLPPVLVIHGTVRDAETNQPIAGAVVTPGVVFDQRNQSGPVLPHWESRKITVSPEGEYEVRVEDASAESRKALMVAAEGYGVEVVPSIPLDAGDRRLDVRLHREKSLEGTVLLPDGQPASDAEVWLVGARDYLSIEDDLHVSQNGCVSVEVRADGHYKLPTVPKPWLLVVLHKQGYAEMKPEDYAKSPLLQLRPWSRIEVTYRIGTRPGGARAVSAQSRDESFGGRGPSVAHILSGVTDAEGCHLFVRVRPGQGYASVAAGEPIAGGHAPRRGCHFDAKPGETVKLTLGGTGRPVVGRLSLPADAQQHIRWETGTGSLRRTVRIGRQLPPIPIEGFAKLSPEEQNRVIGPWLATDEGRAYIQARNRLAKAEEAAHARLPREFHQFGIRKDGSFRMEDIAPGFYGLSIDYYDLQPGGGLDARHLLGRCSTTFEVPEMPGERSDEPLDLGELSLKLEE